MRVLICDDEENIRNLMKRYLQLEDIDSDTAENGFAAQRLMKDTPYDVLLVDLKMPGMGGLELVKWTREEGFRMPIIIISAYSEIKDAVSALKEGAEDYIVKPFNPDEVIIRIKNLVESYTLRSLFEAARRGERSVSFIGESVEIRRIKETIVKIAPSQASVLITGEAGTGKEVIARAIHEASNVSRGPFISINIGGIREGLLESELFGYEKGAFPGAGSRKTGMFELSSGGTLFLDEIGDLPPNLQAKMLKVLQDRKITRLGSTTQMPINARIICATNKSLEDMVRKGLFREDLYYRLNAVKISVPPLRERREDIPLLALDIIDKLNRVMGTKFTGLTQDAIEALKKYSFYGNVRELKNILERAMIYSEGPVLNVGDLDLKAKKESDGRATIDLSSTDVVSLKDIERLAIIRALQRWDGNRTRASEELGISRRTLISKIAEYKIDL